MILSFINKSDAFSIFLSSKFIWKNFLGVLLKHFKLMAVASSSNLNLICPLRVLLIAYPVHTLVPKMACREKAPPPCRTGLTLLSRSNILFHYWPYAFQTTSFLINRMPTLVLHNLSPYQILFHKAPDYFSLHIFGCACYPPLRPY